MLKIRPFFDWVGKARDYGSKIRLKLQHVLETYKNVKRGIVSA
jgi:hypothetical protein